MTIGVVMLVHTALDRAEQVARYWARAGFPVVIHVDAALSHKVQVTFAKALQDVPNVLFSERHRCEWGTWGIVAATQTASELMLKEYPYVRHVLLVSGSCIPLRPARQFQDYLAQRPDTDFIESATVADVSWTVGGLDEERFTLRFPFSWRKNRFLFDRYVQLQRFFRLKRSAPGGIDPHLGSQWWCLTRSTLSAILQDTARKKHDRYFQSVWIPDESYFQTLARKHAKTIESRSLTLSKFDGNGKPHTFYDDHLRLLQRSDCFIARKIWPGANRLYDTFLADASPKPGQHEPNPFKVDRVFERAIKRRVEGRTGLLMQSRFPRKSPAAGIAAAPYWLFQGFCELFEDFETWLAKMTGAQVHGHLFAPERAHFANGQTSLSGALSDDAALRDYNPGAFLSSLIWNTRSESQCFQFGPGDNQDINGPIARDPNARVLIISGAWSIPLFRGSGDFNDLRRQAARLQKIESKQIAAFRAQQTKAQIRIWKVAEFVAAPIGPLQQILDEIGQHAPGYVSEVPRMVDLSGFSQFLRDLRNQGMHPHLMGDFPTDPTSDHQRRPKPSRPYLVR